MSLLMDALKRAEQANQQGTANVQPGERSELSLEPVAATPHPAGTRDSPRESQATLPQLPKLEDLDDEFLAHVKQPSLRSKASGADRTAPPVAPQRTPAQPGGAAPGKPAGRDETADRAAVRNAFAVKQPPETSRAFWIIVGTTASLAAVGIGIYFWLQLQPRSGIAAKQPVAVASAQPAAPANPVAQTAVATLASAPPRLATTSEATDSDSETEDSADKAPASGAGRRTSSGERPAQPSRTATSARSAIPEGAEPIRFAKSPQRTEMPAGDGYLALQEGNIALARTSYQRLLEREPRNADALHGLAAVALRENRPEEAEALYLRILESNPRDAVANAGLLGLRPQSDPVANESRIKTLLAGQPGAPILNFALGNLYARQSRWNEAQQAYFKAYSGDSEHPDYLFNLAVSLDQLHQQKLAAQYYGQALKAAESRSASFDRAQAVARLRALQP